jgi:hypothetical protein
MNGETRRYRIPVRITATSNNRQTRTASMEKWIITGFTALLLLALAALGWHFRQQVPQSSNMCTTADAHCGERRVGG